MGYYIQALISATPTLEPIARVFQQARIVRLSQGFALLPATHGFVEEVARADLASAERAFGQFEFLTPSVAALATNASRISPVVYIETEYFGGIGAQAAIVWMNGEVVFGPLITKNFDEGLQGVLVTSLSEGAINQALRSIGIARGEHADEFDALGLGQCRNTEDWIEYHNVSKVMR
jgi:hypothetical protein